MTRQDINYIMVHILAFIALYAGGMSKLPKGTWFDWGCLSQGLMGIGVAGTAINIAGPSDPEEPTPKKVVTETVAHVDVPQT